MSVEQGKTAATATYPQFAAGGWENASIRVLATHGVLAGNAVDKLMAAPIDEIVITDSIPLAPDKQHPRLRVLSVAPLLAEAIRRVHEDRSISELFV